MCVCERDRERKRERQRLRDRSRVTGSEAAADLADLNELSGDLGLGPNTDDPKSSTPDPTMTPGSVGDVQKIGLQGFVPTQRSRKVMELTQNLRSQENVLGLFHNCSELWCTQAEKAFSSKENLACHTVTL